MHERGRIFSRHLPQEQQREYETRIPYHQRAEFEDSMDAIIRWQDPKFDQLRSGDFLESNRDHIEGMLEMGNAIENRFPNLAEEINFNDARYMIILHDAGEKFVGDVPATGPLRDDHKGQQRKRLEPILFNRFFLPQIENVEVREKVADLYDRYFQQNPTDKEALLAKLLDRTQGTSRVGATHIFNYQAKGIELTPELQRHVQITVKKTLDAATNLMFAVSPDAQPEVQVFMQEELDRIKRAGFLQEAATAYHHIDQVIQSVVQERIIFDTKALDPMRHEVLPLY